MLPAHPFLLGMFSFSLANFGKVSTQKSPLETTKFRCHVEAARKKTKDSKKGRVTWRLFFSFLQLPFLWSQLVGHKSEICG